MENRVRILQANLNNLGGAFSVAYEAQKKLQDEYIFDYFFPDKFVENDVYKHLKKMGSRCIGEIQCKSRIFKQYEIYKTFKKYLENNSYKCVHIHSDTAWKAAIYYLAAKKANIENIVVHSHSSGINGHYKKINYLLHCMAKPIIKKAKFRCACSNIAAKWMFNTTIGVNVIHNGVDVEKYSFDRKARDKIKEKYNIENKIVIGSVSDYSYQKNPEFIFEIIKKFKNNSKYIFLLVGNREECLLKDYIEKDGTIENVIFTGMVTNVQDYLSAMDIFILPSRLEGLPMCALEAQVNGLYTVISDKVAAETQCSKYFSQLKLDVDEWENEIKQVSLNNDRVLIEKFLNIDKVSATNMACAFRKMYRESLNECKKDY